MTPEEREKGTRKQRVDPRLLRSRWNVTAFATRELNSYSDAAVEEFPTAAGPADYALCAGGDALGVVEAKRVSLGPQNVLTQAERYSRGFEVSPIDYGDGFRVPFLYSTNGEVIWFHDIRHPLNRSRKVAHFHTPAALRELLDRDDAGLDRLAGLPYHGLLRDYQIEAHEAVEDALRKRRRKMLLAMATGSGKTLTMVSQVHRLMKAGVARRVLFLVDRRALAAQAVRAFASFEAEPGLKFDKVYEVYSQRFRRDDIGDDQPFDPRVLPASYLTDPRAGHAFVYVCTIQRMTMNLFGRDRALAPDDEPADEDATELLDIPIHAFDLVIADECHRGYSARDVSTWRNTLDHFDAIKIGLTATPAAHTVAYFERPTYRYPYERAVREGHLVDYDAVRVSSGVRINGVFLHPGEHVGLIDPHTGTEDFDLLDDERQYPSEEVERSVTSPDSNRKILEEVRAYADAHEQQFGRFPKTLIFAANDLPHTSHADQLVDAARDVFGRGDAFVAKITGKVDRPLQRIREFRNRPNPGVAVTVDLLSTGVDIPDLEFIVLLRQIKSRILFEQVLGRGTRKGERFPDKSHFVVFDCFDGTLLDYFRDATGITAGAPEVETRSIAAIIEDIWQNVDRDHNVQRLVKRLRRIDKRMSGDARDAFARFLPRGDVGSFAQALPALVRTSFTDTLDLLRDEQFQDLLGNYSRPPRVFVVAYETQDEVSSEWLIRGPSGKEYRPADYLAAFEQFVADNADTVDAIAVLLARPAGWGTDTLIQLREALAQAPEHFTEANLQRAYEITQHKPLADIISMVKRAAGRTSELLTADERVARAMERVVADRQLTPDQAKWLDYIRQHLVANLSIDRDDFENVPVLLNRGGLARAERIFDGELDGLLSELNREVAA